MKIALCLSGQARSFKKGFEYHKKNLLDKYDVDVFIHTWKGDDIDELAKLYKPVDILIEDRLTEDFDSMYTNTPNAEKWPPRFTVAMFYSMFRSNELKVSHEMKEKFTYDWVIKSRPDYALNVVIPFEELDSTKLYAPNCRMSPNRDFCNDQFGFSSSSIMNDRTAIYLYMDHFYDQQVQMIGEDMLQAMMYEKNLVGEKLVYVDMNNPFPPGLHNGTWHSLIRDDYDQWTK
jgi:hypothetical protein